MGVNNLLLILLQTQIPVDGLEVAVLVLSKTL